MTNYIHKGRTLQYVVPNGTTLTVNQAILLGAVLFVVGSTNNQAASVTGDANGTGMASLFAAGVFSLPKTTGSGAGWAIGAKVYWDDTAKKLVNTDNSGANAFIGWGWDKVAADGDATGVVKLQVG